MWQYLGFATVKNWLKKQLKEILSFLPVSANYFVNVLLCSKL